MKIFLCGLPNVGKTSCGQSSAQQLGWTFIDLDRQVEFIYHTNTNIKKTCREIYQRENPSTFRKWEYKALTELKKEDNIIIALGGGTLETLKNRLIIAQLGYLIYLQSSPQILFERIGPEIPSFLDQKNPRDSFLKLAIQRQEIYQHACNCMIDVESLSVETITNHIIEKIKGTIKHGK